MRCGVVLLFVVAISWLRLSDRLNLGVRAPSRTGWGIDAHRFSPAAATFIERAQLPGPLLNNFDLGGYLLYRLHPERRVFIAGNTSMYPLDFLLYYRAHVTSAAADPEELYRRHGVRTVAVDLPSRATATLIAKLAASERWALVFLDRAGAVFVRVDDSTSGVVAEHRVDLAARVEQLVGDDDSDPGMPRWLGGKRLSYPSANLAAFLSAVGRPDLTLREANRVWAESGAEDVAIMAGQAALRTGRMATELPILEEALGRYPGSVALANLTAVALAARADELMSRGAVEEAERDLRRMLDLTPDACGPYTGLAKVAAARGDDAAARRLLGQAATKEGAAACRRNAEGDPLLGRLLR